MTDSSRWKATVYVGGLGPQVTVANLHDAFIPFGEINNVSLPMNTYIPKRDRPEGADQDGAASDRNGATSHRGFACVEFEDADDAKEAIDNMDKSDFFGRTIKVTAAKEPKAATEGLGSRTALWDQEAWKEQNAAAEDSQLLKLGDESGDGPVADPMQGLDDLDVAGPRPA
ncbi:hypothetical protein SEPCBS119000_005488 [Sporothrix epigloea]|uniref:RRM domain-containing protein n=1 Tax=Sporothrix epigloea TaxID=1892477 RepID=A0ABP0E047_9PEZI